jgi:N-acetylmuramoyl-L-alanine amidase
MGALPYRPAVGRKLGQVARGVARWGPVLLLVFALWACARITPRTHLPHTSLPSPNFDQRRPNFVIIHHTSKHGAEEALATLTDPLRRVSAHYLIARDGAIYALVDELARAWHAGESYWGGSRDLNSASIGIELDNNGEEPFAGPQIEALLRLLADIQGRYKIPTANFLGHGDVAPTRKIDPSQRFPWRRLAEHGFGLWCEPPYPPVRGDADEATLLAALGYDTRSLPAARAAFKRHFAPDSPSAEMTMEERALLQCLIDRKILGGP